jgi:hypothetical protein
MDGWIARSLIFRQGLNLVNQCVRLRYVPNVLRRKRTAICQPLMHVLLPCFEVEIIDIEQLHVSSTE